MMIIGIAGTTDAPFAAGASCSMRSSLREAATEVTRQRVVAHPLPAAKPPPTLPASDGQRKRMHRVANARAINAEIERFH
jgi:hypothetical protein